MVSRRNKRKETEKRRRKEKKEKMTCLLHHDHLPLMSFLPSFQSHLLFHFHFHSLFLLPLHNTMALAKPQRQLTLHSSFLPSGSAVLPTNSLPAQLPPSPVSSDPLLASLFLPPPSPLFLPPLLLLHLLLLHPLFPPDRDVGQLKSLLPKKSNAILHQQQPQQPENQFQPRKPINPLQQLPHHLRLANVGSEALPSPPKSRM